MKLDDLIEQSHGKFITVKFIKKDGTLRTMRCRTGVTKYLKGGQSTLDPAKFVTVFDVDKGEYRAINRDTIVSVACEGNVYVNPDLKNQDN